jgi:hypothetical protein
LVAPGFPLVYDLTKNGTDLGGIVNAVDIDWNSGKIVDGNNITAINTTGDLLYFIQGLLTRIKTLESKLN